MISLFQNSFIQFQYFVIEIIIFIVSLSLILWGLKYFKFYITFIGICSGAILGFLIGSLVFRSQIGSTLGSIILGISFGYIAWSVQKIIVFINCGLIFSLIAIILSKVAGIEGGLIFIIGLIFFFAGGLLSFWMYEIIIIITFAVIGINNIFNLLYSNIFGFYTNPFAKWIVIEYIDHKFTYLLMLIIIILWSLYFQKRLSLKKTDDKQIRNNKKIFRFLTYYFTAILIFGFFLYGVKNYYVREMHDALFPFTDHYYFLIGFNFISWPFVTIITYYSFKIIKKIGTKVNEIYINRAFFYLISLIIGVIVLPSLNFITYTLKSISPLYLQSITMVEVIKHFTGFYKFYYSIPIELAITKFIFSIILFPTFLTYFLLKFMEDKKNDLENNSSLQ